MKHYVLLSLTMVMLLVTSACNFDSTAETKSEPRPITAAEAEVLANVRFRNFDAGSRKISVEYMDQGHKITLEGWFDYTTHTGYALLSTDGRPNNRIVWDGQKVAMTHGTQLGTPMKSLKGWKAARLDPQNSPIAVVLIVLANLGADRPENPLLIRQGGALWLREDRTNEQQVTVFTGPTAAPGENSEDSTDTEATSTPTKPASERSNSSRSASGSPIDPAAAGIRYWVDGDGLAHRIDVRLGQEWAHVRFENDGVTVPPLLHNVNLENEKSAEESNTHTKGKP